MVANKLCIVCILCGEFLSNLMTLERTSGVLERCLKSMGSKASCRFMGVASISSSSPTSSSSSALRASMAFASASSARTVFQVALRSKKYL